MIGAALRQFTLGACGCTFSFICAEDEVAVLLRSAFAGLLISNCMHPSAVQYIVSGGVSTGTFRVSDGHNHWSLDDTESLVFHLDKEMTLALQRRRPDLLFLHAAVVAWNGRAAVLPAFSGTGKSTLTLVLLEGGCEYLSDELAPIDLHTLTVFPYAHALNLKEQPPAPYSLPDGTRQYGHRFDVPATAFRTCDHALPLAALIFLKRDEQRVQGLRTMTAASAVVRLMAHALNLLAHPGYGFDATVALARAVPCYELDVFDLQAAGAAIKSFLADGESSNAQNV